MENKAKILRFPTLRIVDLLGTSIQSVRLELVGANSRSLVRLGTWLLYLPFMMVGYLFVMAALARWVAITLGWGVTLLLFGGLHLLVGSLGAVFGSSVGSSGVQPVLEPRLDSPNTAAHDPRSAPALPPRPGSVSAATPAGRASSPLPSFLTTTKGPRAAAAKKAALPPLSRPSGA